MSLQSPVITIQELDNYDSLVNAALSAAYTRAVVHRSGGSVLPASTQVTLTWSPEVSKGGPARTTTPARQVNCYVTVSSTAPASYTRGQVWLCTDATSTRYRTFFISSTTSPETATWHPVTDPSLLFSEERALAIADTSAQAPGVVRYDPVSGAITDPAAISALQAVPGLGVLPIGASWAAFGDSMAADNSFQFARWDGRTVTGLSRNGYLVWASVLSNRRVYFRHENNFGVGGETSEQMDDQLALSIASDTDGVVINAPINDLTNAVPWATTRANIIRFCQGHRAVGKQVVMLPAGPTTNASATYQLLKARYNNFILRALPALVPGVMTVNANSMLVSYGDANGHPVGGGGGWNDATAYTRDGVHARARYAYAQGKALAEVFSLVYPGSGPLSFDPRDVYDATSNPGGNVLPNPMFATAGSGTANGGVTGQVHANLTVNRPSGAGTVACSKTTRDAGNGNTINEQTIVITAPAEGGGAVDTEVTFYWGATNAPAVGQTSEFLMHVSFVGGSRVKRFDVEVRENSGAGAGNATQIMGEPEGVDANYFPDVSWSGVVSGTIQQTAAGGAQNLIIGYITVAPGSTPVTIRISSPEYRNISAIA